jgi:signal transduction histidine kinase/ligand-binding sensor domain-containing protein
LFITRFLIIILIAFSSVALQGQGFPNRFFTYDDVSGFSPHYVHKVAFDKRGIMWIGTPNGLYRFDNYRFKAFKHNVKDSTSLPITNINMLFPDHEGNLLIGDSYQFFEFDPEKETYRKIILYDKEDRQNLDAIRKYSFKHIGPGEYMFVCEKGLGLIKDTLGSYADSLAVEFFQDFPWMDADLSRYYPHIKDSKGRIWIGYEGGLVVWDIANFRILKVPYGPPGAQGGVERGVRDVAEGKEGKTFWLACLSGFVKITLDDNMENYQTSLEIDGFPVDGSPNENAFVDVHVDSKGMVWAGSFRHGLFVIDPKTGRQQNYAPSVENRYSFPNEFAQSIAEDPSGNIWVGSPSGISLVRGQQTPFHLYPDPGDPAQKLQGEHIYDFAEDDDGNLWIANREGLTRVNESSNEYETIGAAEGMKWVFAVDMEYEAPDKLWIFSKGALQKMDLNDRTFEDYQAHGLAENVVNTLDAMSMERTIDGKIWLSSIHGALRFDPETDSFTDIPGKRRMYYNILRQSPDGSIWVGSSEQMTYVDQDTLRPFEPKGDAAFRIKGNKVRDIHFSGDSILWVGTTGGLFKIHLRDSTVNMYNENDALPDDYIRCIEEDDQGRLWLGNDGGLSCLNPFSEDITNYSYHEYFDIRFYSRASYKRRDGRMCFGGAKGFIQFHPDSLKPNSYAAPAYLTDIFIFNERVPLEHEKVTTNHLITLAGPLHSLDAVSVKHRHRTFSIGFSVLNYVHPERCKFAYKMEGYDPDWTETNAYNRKATYTNLDPGTYTFLVKASNNDGVWNEEPTRIKIHIKPPWYTSWMAIGLYILIAALLVSLYIYSRIRKVRREYQTRERILQAKEEEREWVRKQSARDFHDEAGNKLTKLSLYTGLLRQKFGEDEETGSLVTQMERNLRELGTGMRDFIWVLDPSQDSLAETIQRIAEFGQSLFAHSETAFSYQIDNEALKQVPLDIKNKRHLLLIFKEAMNNCLKYAQASEARLEASVQHSTLYISFKDNGIGFDLDKKSQGYGLSNMKTRAKEIGGELTIRSESTKGSSMTLRKTLG